MGSGFSGKYQGTYSSKEGEEIRRQLLESIERAGGMLVGDSVVDLAEALVRIAAGESADEVEFPEMSDVAIDLALDALSAFMPGGATATRSLSLAVKYSERAKRAKRAFKPRVPGEVWVEPDEYRMVMSKMTKKEAKGEVKAGTSTRVWTDEYSYTVQIDGLDEYYIVKRRKIE